MFKDLKYLIAYIAPLSCFFGLWQGGVWSFTTVAITFLIIPMLEMLFPPGNQFQTEETHLLPDWFFDLLLYLNLPILYGIIYWYLSMVSAGTMDVLTTIGNTLSVGIIMGATGINVAHELGHRMNKLEPLMARLLLTPAFYIHFQIAHNQGHHLKVGTPEDPATARRDESIYAFFLRTIPGNYFEAWGLERKRLKRQGKTVFSLHNKMVQYTLLTVTYVVVVAVYFGPRAVLMSFIIGLIGILLLESVNYIEHYGLMRKKLPNGRYENVNESHSWNSDHALGRIFLYELTRHTDHHLKSTRPYEDLRHINGSPQLPYGYPASILLSYFPGLWKRHIHPVLDTFEGQQ